MFIFTTASRDSWHILMCWTTTNHHATHKDDEKVPVNPDVSNHQSEVHHWNRGSNKRGPNDGLSIVWPLVVSFPFVFLFVNLLMFLLVSTMRTLPLPTMMTTRTTIAPRGNKAWHGLPPGKFWCTRTCTHEYRTLFGYGCSFSRVTCGFLFNYIYIFIFLITILLKNKPGAHDTSASWAPAPLVIPYPSHLLPLPCPSLCRGLGTLGWCLVVVGCGWWWWYV